MKRNIKPDTFNRNAAFSMKLANPESDVTDAIHCMLNLKGSLISFLENSIAKVLPAETVDPHNKHPETRHSYQFMYSIGSSNSFVARSILQAKDVLGSVILNKGLNKQEILDHIWDCTQHLINCENSYYEIYSDTMELMKKCDEIINQSKVASHVPSLPQVKNLEQRVVTFLGNGKRFMEKSHELLCIFYGCTCYGSDFPSYKSWMAKNKKHRTEIISFLEQEKGRMQQLAWYRNALDINHSRPGFRVILENFKLHAGNKFSNPCWRYDFSDRKGELQDNPSDLINDMDVLITNMLTFFEELFLLCVKDNWDVRWNFEIYRHKEESINVKCPILYYVSRKQE